MFVITFWLNIETDAFFQLEILHIMCIDIDYILNIYRLVIISCDIIMLHDIMTNFF